MHRRRGKRVARANFSALQRAENSSIVDVVRYGERAYDFSALQRAENSSMAELLKQYPTLRGNFSALQRAENSSI